jgi:hypothetical protein
MDDRHRVSDPHWADVHPHPLRQEFIVLSDVFGVPALVDALNNPRVGTATESSLLGPFFTEDAPDRACYFRFCAKGPSRSPRC